jgi:methylglutaconyl-CoA hydratase
MLNLKNVETDRNDKLITLWLNKPDTRNALDYSLTEELIRVFKWINEQKDIQVIILRGRGKSFCSGADIKWMTNSGFLDYKDCYKDSELLAECFHIIYQSDKVVINLVHGDVSGGAFGFLGASDFTFAVKGTRFCLPELRLGLIPSVIIPYLITKVKPADIKYYTLTTEIFSAEEACDKGFIEYVCHTIGEAEHNSNELIKKIYDCSPAAIAESKHLYRALNKSLINTENIKNTIAVITRLKMSDDSRERISAFFTNK